MVVGSRNSKARLYEAAGFKTAHGSLLCEAQSIERVAKFKGAAVAGLQIKPSFSEDERYVISASEDGCVFIWDRCVAARLYKLYCTATLILKLYCYNSYTALHCKSDTYVQAVLFKYKLCMVIACDLQLMCCILMCGSTTCIMQYRLPSQISL
jgi:hypothetical protein